jgi:hypothetical protein
MLENRSTRLDWVLYGVPVQQGRKPEPSELRTWLGAKLEVRVLMPFVHARKSGTDKTMAFVTTEGITKAMHRAVTTGILYTWQAEEKAAPVVTKLDIRPYKDRDAGLHSSGCKVHGASEVEAHILALWVKEIMQDEDLKLRVEGMGFETRVEGLEGEVMGIYLENTDLLRQLHFRTVWTEAKLLDKKGNNVEQYAVQLPLLRDTDK